jgi:broad-specificity NMP kinase
MAGCLLITGTPSAGKTTVSQLILAEAAQRAVVTDSDLRGPDSQSRRY